MYRSLRHHVSPIMIIARSTHGTFALHNKASATFSKHSEYCWCSIEVEEATPLRTCLRTRVRSEYQISETLLPSEVWRYLHWSELQRFYDCTPYEISSSSIQNPVRDFLERRSSREQISLSAKIRQLLFLNCLQFATWNSYPGLVSRRR